MNLGKKLAALINAGLRGARPRQGQRRHAPEADPAGQIEAVRQALAEVEARERAVADQLQATEASAAEAAAQGDRETARRQQRLARELKAHLATQSTQTGQLQARLAALEEQLDQTRRDAGERLAASSEAEETAAEPAADQDPNLDERKSRLSG